ncbi:UvrD-helicase domain-containing protein [Thalassobaculum sp. OXR-137]|uniref:ATP-dependent helicase n=1 Tax=Thalassobaculum sp. OXR-137 TaxID=3100173 RepID=UPI002AC8BC6F|nr:UvrD-helicase domain-containing protein [Thalassobaculum sp. OXR-137]WPZ36145.1 UvrD-helicase domain-containing protein [Thalassobaculum sp. OXR-137]
MADLFSKDDDGGIDPAAYRRPSGPAPAYPGPGHVPAIGARGGYLDGLNEGQRAAVDALDGPVLVLAGAGTGKTRVLTTRLSHLMAMGKAKPWNVLAVTFTNKAAREMKERVGRIVGPAAEQVWLGTFHALCARILRRHAELVGLKSNFTILDTDDQIRLLKQVLQAENVDDKRWPARVVMGVLQRWKDRGLTPDKIGVAEAGDMAGGKLQDIYRQYQDRLTTLNAADFGDLLLHCLTLFQTRPEVLQQYQTQFRYILVDEYQDTNVAQYLWLRLLAQSHRNICCVGDDDQSIYGWRGAEIGNILKFEKDFPGAKVVRLEQNYRSTSRILAAASDLIAHNEGRLGKTLWTEGADGDQLTVRGVWDGEEEARVVGDRIEDYQRAKVPLREMAVLVRAGFQTREFEERLITLGVPYRVVGGARFYERKEIRDAIAYLRVIAQPDDDLAFERIINTPARGIGKTTEQVLFQHARSTNIPLTIAAEQLVQSDELKPAARRAVGGLMGDFARWREASQSEDPSDLARMVLDESGYTAALQKDKSPEAPGRLENLKELVTALEEFESLGGFLEHISLVMENAEAADGEQVSLMTLHAAKGLEFDVVFLPGWEEGMFPNQRALDENGAAGLEEERRLAYVGLTRARKKVEIVFAANRRVHGLWQSAIPSRFVSELPSEHVEMISEAGLYGSGSSGYGAGGYGYGGGRTGYGRGDGMSYDRDDDAKLPTWDSAGRAGKVAGRGPGYMRRGGGSIRTRAPVIDGEGYTVDRSKPAKYAVDERVFHQKFGMGTVTKVDGDKLEVEFDHAGHKNVVDTFVSKP